MRLFDPLGSGRDHTNASRSLRPVCKSYAPLSTSPPPGLGAQILPADELDLSLELHESRSTKLQSYLVGGLTLEVE